MTVLTSLPAWQTLSQLYTTIGAEHMRDWFDADPKRAENMQIEACGIHLDYS